jgi:hypothetical protein
MISIFSESLVRLSAAGRHLPGNPSLPTLWRWHSRGVRGVRLETVALGGRRYTSREALERFVSALSSPSKASNTIPKQRAEAISRAADHAARLVGNADKATPQKRAKQSALGIEPEEASSAAAS